MLGSIARRQLRTAASAAWCVRAQSTLAHRVFEAEGAAPTRTAFVMHGILGNKLNWRTFSQKFTAVNPDWRLVTIDLRGHGESPSFTPPHDLKACANDVLSLASHLDVEPEAVFGHSFGGKVALSYLQECQQQSRVLPRQVWVLDSLPGTGKTDYANRSLTSSIETVLPAVKEIPLPILSKSQLVKDLQAKGIGLGEAQWLTTNLRLMDAQPEQYEWKMDIDVIEQLFQAFLATDLWPVVTEPPAVSGEDVRIHFVRAERNSMWTPQVLAALDALKPHHVYHHLLAKSGHWVHIDNLPGLLDIIHANMEQ